MNMQNLLNQAKTMQKQMLEAQNEVESKEFTITKNFVTITMTGKKQITNIEIKQDNLDKDDIEVLQDLIKLSVNECINNIDKELNNKLAKFKGIPGLF